MINCQEDGSLSTSQYNGKEEGFFVAQLNAN